MAAVRAVAVLAAGAAGAEGLVVRDVLLAAVRAGAGVRAAHPAAAADDAAPVAAARALVAVRPAAETDNVDVHCWTKAFPKDFHNNRTCAVHIQAPPATFTSPDGARVIRASVDLGER